MKIYTVIKKLFLILSILFSFIFSANPAILSEFDYLAKIVAKDIQEAVYDGIIPAEIAITSFSVYGFKTDERQYLEEVMNRIFYSDIAFKLISIPASKLITVEEKGDKIIIKKGASRNSDLKDYAESINSKHYGEIYVYLFGKRIFLRMLVHDADSGDVVWSEDWSVKRADRLTFEFGYLFGFADFLTAPSTEHYLHLFFGSRVVGFGEFGVSINFGAGLPILKGNAILEEANEINVFFNFILTPKVSLNLFELAGMSYFDGELFLLIEPGLKMKMLILGGKSGLANLYQANVFFSANLGFILALKHNINIQASYDHMTKTIMSGVYYKF